MYSDGEPPEDLVKCFKQRCDNQIMSLEVLAISFGLETFAEELRDRSAHKFMIIVF